MNIDLNEDQVKMLMTLLSAASRIKEEKAKGEVIEGVEGHIKVSGPVLCPEMCFRFQETGTCIHLEIKKEKIELPYTRKFQAMRAAKKAAKVAEEKGKEKFDTGWVKILKEEWKSIPFTFGVYLWLDEAGRVVFYGTARDLRRRHYTWAMFHPIDVRWQRCEVIWWLHTGWRAEVLAELDKLPANITISREALEAVLRIAKPLILPPAPEFVR